MDTSPSSTPYCLCLEPCRIQVSHSEKNPGRRFYTCDQKPQCKTFKWIDASTARDTSLEPEPKRFKMEVAPEASADSDLMNRKLLFEKIMLLETRVSLLSDLCTTLTETKFLLTQTNERLMQLFNRLPEQLL